MRLRLQGVLDELLLDRGGALDGALAHDVLDERARDAADVDAGVGLKALVLDRDHGLLDDRRDLRRGDDDAVLLADDADGMAQVVEQHGAARVLELGEAGQGREIGGDGDEHAEHERHETQQQRREQDREKAQPLQARLARGCVVAIVLAHRLVRAAPGAPAEASRWRWPASSRHGPTHGRAGSLALGLDAESH